MNEMNEAHAAAVRVQRCRAALLCSACYLWRRAGHVCLSQSRLRDQLSLTTLQQYVKQNLCKILTSETENHVHLDIVLIYAITCDDRD